MFERLYGLVIFNHLRSMRTGATRSIRLAKGYLEESKVFLDFVMSHSILHFLCSLRDTGRISYDFLLFNGLASIGRQSHFGQSLWKIGRGLGLPVFIYWHESNWVLERQQQNSPTSFRRVKYIASSPATIHLTASQACSESICRWYPAARPTEIYECAEITPPFDQPVMPSSPPLVVNLASIQPRKGTDLFVETALKVCQQHPTVEFVWMGDGQPFGTWREMIVSAGMEHRILFPGYMEAGYMMLRRASVFFLSSRDDPFPLSVLEAMSLGRSVVTFDVGGAPEALGGYGDTVPPYDTDAAADAILRCLEKRPEKRLKPELRQRYQELYTPGSFAARLNQVLRKQISYGP